MISQKKTKYGCSGTLKVEQRGKCKHFTATD